jgi:hypothetical protein
VSTFCLTLLFVLTFATMDVVQIHNMLPCVSGPRTHKCMAPVLP